MNLVIDVGNTSVKLAVFKDALLFKKEVVMIQDLLETISKIKEENKTIKNVIVSSVGNLDKEVLEYLDNNFQVLFLSHQTKLPFKNLYETPNTLGIDRIALIAASVDRYSEKNVLVIDAGTCITYDFINKENEYLGGAISPGIRMRYKALYNQTAKLPLLDTEAPENLIGNSTITSINSGVVNGLVNEIDGVIAQYKEKYNDLTIILTGGDANFLSKQLKSSIFANSNFLLQGLNFILLNNLNE
ncbi:MULTISPECIES: type III pantothenate kinase [Mesoflavibacter]|uniref:type III pantothenate kinase n=1 Tax=Mesoflavibacter TaxID=444051 RepID=UPI00243884A7|nr:type III pantothenate kinase [Mesoflavibacter zeaxanthinifaciens]